MHFIFAIDESGSMQGRKWRELFDALNDTIKKIHTHNIKGG
jgi:hypothetical protein